VWSWTILRSACWAERNQKKQKFRGWHNLVNGFVIMKKIICEGVDEITMNLCQMSARSWIRTIEKIVDFSGIHNILSFCRVIVIYTFLSQDWSRSRAHRYENRGAYQTRVSLGWSFMGKDLVGILFIDNWLCPSSANQNNHLQGLYCRLERRAEAWQWHVWVTQVDIYLLG